MCVSVINFAAETTTFMAEDGDHATIRGRNSEIIVLWKREREGREREREIGEPNKCQESIKGSSNRQQKKTQKITPQRLQLKSA